MSQIRYQKSAGITHSELLDGIMVYDLEMKIVNYLNPAAALIFVLLESPLSLSEIAQVLSEEFGLDAPPLRDVEVCVSELLSKGLIEQKTA